MSSGILKTSRKSSLLSWVTETFKGAIGTRYARVTWQVSDPEATSRERCPGLKLQIKLSPSSCCDNLRSLLIQSDKVVSHADKKHGFSQSLKYEESQAAIGDGLVQLCQQFSGTGVSKTAARNWNFLRVCREDLAREKVIVEFGSPNIAKPLHMGHLRSSVTGNYVARICKAAGHEVTTICFLGDWGTQFGILQAGLSKWIPDKDLLSVVDEMDLDELLKYYVRSVKENELNGNFSSEALQRSASLEMGETESLKLWKLIRDKTLEHLKSFWSTFGIQYDVIQGESEFTVQSNYTVRALKVLEELDLVEVGDDKCIYARLPPDEKFLKTLKAALVKKDGSSLYLLRDIACAISRLETFKFDRMLYVVDKTQAHHFIFLFRVLTALKIQEHLYNKDEWLQKLRHLSFGKVEGMSTRAGNFVLLSDVVRDGSEIMEEARQKSPNTRNQLDSSVATKLAISALVINSLKVRRNRDVKFEWTEALRATGETGVNLQYTHARLCSLEKKALASKEISNFKMDLSSENIKQIMSDTTALDLAVHLLNFEDSFWASYAELEPCILLTYMFKLTDKVSKALKELQVLSEPDTEKAHWRLILFLLSKDVLAFGLTTVGLDPLNEI